MNEADTDTDTDTDTAAAPGPSTGRHGGWAFALLVLGSLVALLSTVTTWVERQALDTDAWVEATDQLLADNEVRGALAIYLVDELYAATDVGDAIGDLLPSDLESLGDIVAGALRGPATDAVDRLLSSDVVRTAWREANRAAHELLLAVIEDDTGDVLSTAGGVVSIDLGELVRALGERIGLGERILDALPEDAGVVVLFESDELELLQDAAQTVNLLSAFLFLLVVALFGAAIYLAPDRRRTVRDVGLALTGVGLLVLLARIAGVEALAGSLSRASDDEPALSVLHIGSTMLRQIAFTEVIIGLALVGFAVLAGPADLARRIRQLLVPVLRYGVAAAVGGGILVFLLLLWLRPGGPIAGWIPGLLVAGLCVAGVAWVQRVTLAEHPRPALVPADD